MGFMTTNTDHVTKSNVWSTDLKALLEAELIGMNYVRMLPNFDGTTLNIPSIGQHELNDYVEGQPVRYTAMDTGNFTFSVNDYKSAATYITEKARQDWFIASELERSFVPKQHRALMADIETKIMALAPNAQTASSTNSWNGAAHRVVGGGSGGLAAVVDFAKMKYALDKAFVPAAGRVAIVDPTVEYQLNTLSNLVSVQNNPQFEGIINTGMSDGMRYSRSLFGFDVYVSNFLKSGISETVDSVSVTSGVANLFFSMADDQVKPFIGNIKQAPKVDSEYNKDYQREEYVTTARYDFALWRPEAVAVLLTKQALA